MNESTLSYPRLYEALRDLKPACEIDLSIQGRYGAMTDGIALWGGADDNNGVRLVMSPEGSDWTQHRVSITYDGSTTDLEQVLSDAMPLQMMAAVLVAMFQTATWLDDGPPQPARVVPSRLDELEAEVSALRQRLEKLEGRPQ